MEMIPHISGFWALVLLVLGFGFIIFVHELGHFLVAKWVGIRVTQFAIGFGHALVCWRKGIGFRIGTTEPEYQRRVRAHLEATSPGQSVNDSLEAQHRAADALGLGETEYRVNWMPLGGYVKMVGQEDLDATATSDDPRAYNNKPIWARMLVVSAGVVMNAIFAMLFFMFAFTWGVEFPPAAVGDVAPGSPAATTAAVGHPDVVGLATGDKLVMINGKKPSDFTDLKLASALAAPGEQIDLVVDRPAADGTTHQLEFRVQPIKDPTTGMFYLGIGQPVSLQIAALTTSDRALKAAGVNADMHISAVDGKPINAFWQFQRAVREDGEHHRKIQLTFTDGKSTATVAFAPLTDLAASEGSADRPNLLGLIPPARVMDISPHMPADGKLQPGDVIVAVNGQKWPSSTEASKMIAASASAVEFTVLRDGKPMQVTVKPDRGSLGMSKPLVGVIISQAVDTNLIAGVLNDSPLAPLKLTPQSRVLSIDGHAIHSFTDIRNAVEQSDGTIHVTYQLPISNQQWQKTVTIPAAAMAKLRSLRWSLGEQTPLLEPEMVLQQAGSLGEAVQMGFAKTDLFLKQTYVTLVRLAQRTVPASEMRGPIGILEAGTKVTRQGVAYLMFFLGLISINLSVINFLPMPIVDGGLFVLLVVEKLRGKPVPPQVANAINLVGIVLLGSVFLFVTYHDIARMVTGARVL